MVLQTPVRRLQLIGTAAQGVSLLCMTISCPVQAEVHSQMPRMSRHSQQPLAASGSGRVCNKPHCTSLQTLCLWLQAGKDCNEPILYEFSKQALRDAGAFHDVPPFAAIASNEYDLSVGR